MSEKRSISLYALIFTVGAASLGAEIAAARLLAPFFGASTIIWANTIGVVLASLSVGYWVGGRFADRHPTRAGLSLICLVAALMLGAVPFIAIPFLDVSVEALDTVSAGAFIGSLIAVLVLVAPPVMLLGAASPFAIRLATDTVERAGTVAGRIYAISTVGSLVGTFASALFLIPLVGTRRTFLIFSVLLATVAVLGLKRRYLVAPAVLAAAIALPVGIVKAGSEGRVVFETETPYQYVRVVEDGKSRYLELNEGKAVHSLYRKGSYLTDNVWDAYLVMPFVTLATPPKSILMLGNAAGTTARAYGRYFPETRFDAVEIDAKLTEIGRRYFDLKNPRMRVYHEDARPFLRKSKQTYDVIALDAYRQPYIPFYLTTREFFQLVSDHLTKRGVVLVNVGHPEGNDDLEAVIAATMAEVFPRVVRYPAEPTNTVLVGTFGRASGSDLRSRLGRLPSDLVPIARRAAREITPAATNGQVYTDDKAPVEWLIDKSIVEFAARSD